jgi:hypothetical protein
VLLLATQAEPQMRRFDHPRLGRLVQPRHYPRLADTAARGVPWAADNDAFGGFDGAKADRFERMLAARGLPVDYVLQEDGFEYEPRGIPWGSIRALFIGCGDDREKLGPRVRAPVAGAKGRGKWVHMGTVNTARRVAYARKIGCDSIDGTKWVRWRDTYQPEGLGLVSAPPQMSLLPRL